MKFTTIMLLAGTMTAFAMPASAQDAEAGEKVFRKCKACHVADEAKNKVGPHLVGIFDRKPGTVEGFKYSDAMIAYGADHVWDEATLTAYLADPKGAVKGTKMAFAGLKKPEDVANLLAYLKEETEE